MAAFYSSKAEDFSLHIANENNTIALNKELLKQLLEIVGVSKKEDLVIEFIKRKVIEIAPNAIIEVDSKNNIYVTKGDSEIYPCFAAHMDEVTSNGADANRTIFELNNHFIGLDVNTGEPAGCPGDDRVGCYLNLEMLRVFDNVKLVFFVEEEIGMVGSSNCDMAFFNDASWIIQSDRRGNDDFITYTNGTEVCSTELLEFLSDELKMYGYSKATGVATDVGALVNNNVGICCVNIGSGYYNAHSKSERVCLSDVENMINFAFKIACKTQSKRWEFTPERKTYTTRSYGSSYKGTYGGVYGGDYDDDYYAGYYSHDYYSNKGASIKPGTVSSSKAIQASVQKELFPKEVLDKISTADIDNLNMYCSKCNSTDCATKCPYGMID